MMRTVFKRNGQARRLVIVLAWFAVLSPVAAQDGTRQIWDSGFRQKRPSPSRTSDAPAPGTPGIVYEAAGPIAAPTPSSRVVGFTVWRLQPARPGDTAPRLLVQEGELQPARPYVPERLPAGAPLRVGDRIRLGIEVAHAGYLYVVDRERYVDGTYGAPHLIFPARNLRGGDNRIEPGRLIEIPGQTDRVPALRIERSDPRYVGEELLLIVTSQPIPDLTIEARETPLSAARVTEWERLWGSETVRLDWAGAAPVWTAAEQAAGLRQRLLTQEDPMPASLFKVELKGDGALVRIPLAVE